MADFYTTEVTARIRESIDGRYVCGNTGLIELLLTAYFARGHVLIEGPPGTGKTLTAKVLARVLSRSFKRIQFTSDMLPADILGASIYSPEKQDFRFVPGPIFSDFIVADEVNRTPPRTQSALLEAMEERQVTIEGKTHALSPHFLVVATQNPTDFEGTFPLPESQLDRFLMKLKVEHADAAAEMAIVEKVLARELPPRFDDIRPLEIDRARIDAEIERVRVDRSLVRYAAEITAATRVHAAASAGSSVRGAIALTTCARIKALVAGRDFATPDDIKALAIPVLSHRVRLNPEARVSGLAEEALVADVLKTVAFPG